MEGRPGSPSKISLQLTENALRRPAGTSILSPIFAGLAQVFLTKGVDGAQEGAGVFGRDDLSRSGVTHHLRDLAGWIDGSDNGTAGGKIADDFGGKDDLRDGALLGDEADVAGGHEAAEAALIEEGEKTHVGEMERFGAALDAIALGAAADAEEQERIVVAAERGRV